MKTARGNRYILWGFMVTMLLMALLALVSCGDTPTGPKKITCTDYVTGSDKESICE